MQSSSLYIHYPFCKKLCNYCDFYKTTISPKQSYKDLEKGINTHFNSLISLIDENGAEPLNTFDTIYVGGGTPSLWDEDGAKFLSDFFNDKSLKFNSNLEFTMEVDPGAWTENGLKAWSEAGVNRYSIGLQSLNSDFVKIMDRSHDVGDSIKTLKYFHDSKCNFSVDLMLGLPHSIEKKRRIEDEIDMAMKYGPSHFSVYILKTRNNYPHNSNLPDDDYVSDEYLRVSRILRSYGFDHYEVSNFGLPGLYSKHNQKYWKAETVHALGPNATGFLRLPDEKAIRYQHRPSNTGVTQESLRSEDLKLEKVYLALRTSTGLDLNDHFRPEKLQHLILKWKELQYVKSFTKDNLILSPQGYLMIDSIMDDLFKAGVL